MPVRHADQIPEEDLHVLIIFIYLVIFVFPDQLKTFDVPPVLHLIIIFFTSLRDSRSASQALEVGTEFSLPPKTQITVFESRGCDSLQGEEQTDANRKVQGAARAGEVATEGGGVFSRFCEWRETKFLIQVHYP